MKLKAGDSIFTEARDGEVSLPFDPADSTPDAHLVFIGTIHTPWTERRQCPRNSIGSDAQCVVEVSPDYRAGLTGVSSYTHLIVLYWMNRSRRDLIIQAPRHATDPRGCFGLRSPVRPNPVALSVVELLACDVAAGCLTIRGIDCLDGTPLIDIKPYFASTDARPDAVSNRG